MGKLTKEVEVIIDLDDVTTFIEHHADPLDRGIIMEHIAPFGEYILSETLCEKEKIKFLKTILSKFTLEELKQKLKDS